MPAWSEPERLTCAGLDVTGRALFLTEEAASAWRAMKARAEGDGARLLLLSGHRTIARQTEIIARKLSKGLPLEEILRVNAYPGYSEHHTGRAIDIGSPDCRHLTETFEATREFNWLNHNANQFGFSLSYPRRNPFGINFEPWHWFMTGRQSGENRPTTTYLEMTSPAQLLPRRCADLSFVVSKADASQWGVNRDFYARVGADWHWVDRLNWTEQQWKDYASRSDVHTFVAYYDGAPAGYFELKGTEEVEIVYFGLTPKYIGRGFGGAFLTTAIEEAWRTGCRRVWLHTCTADHPAALMNYKARGMVVTKMETHPAGAA